jgi:hypothetical protein
MKKKAPKKKAPPKNQSQIAGGLGGTAMTRLSGRELDKKWDVGAQHALYREDGRWYMPLERFLGALFDLNGYVLFSTKQQYETSPYLRIGLRVNVPGGIASMPTYVKMR